MTVFLIAALAVALAFSLRALWKQNHALHDLEQAARRGQPLLHDESPAASLPAWPALT